MILDDIFISSEWCFVNKFYNKKIQQVNEGIKILGEINSSYDSKAAYCLSYIFHDDKDFKSLGQKFIKLRGFTKTVFLAMEYRGIIHCKEIKLSPLKEVNDIIIAHKIQSKNHPEKRKEWLKALGISEKKIQDIFAKI